MSKQVFINYWIGQEPTGPGQSPTLNQMPAYVDIVPLAFVGIDDNHELDFGFLTQQNSADTIKGWVKDVQANGTKVLFSILSDKFTSIPDKDIDAFAKNVKKHVDDWGVDGVDIDFEPPSPNDNVLKVLHALKTTLGPDATFTTPIYSPWQWFPKDFVQSFASYMDYVTTMDYTPYPGFQVTIDNFNAYADLIGSTDKLVIGVSCMEPPNNFTPIDDVIKFSQWEPNGGQKGGMMLYTFSYDITSRPGGGTGLPNGAFTKAIHDNLPTSGAMKSGLKTDEVY